MKTKTITLYSFDELSKEAQKRAHEDWIETNDYYFLSDMLNERLHELLQENKIKDLNDTSKPGTKPTPVLYSLSSSQGDGACFEGEFEWNKYTVYIKWTGGHYYHSYSTSIELQETKNLGFHVESSHKDYIKFEQIYQKICKELEQEGYDYMEYEDSLEHFREECDSCDWTFTSDGIMEN